MQNKLATFSLQDGNGKDHMTISFGDLHHMLIVIVSGNFLSMTERLVNTYEM
jgi:hypothetical protein